MASREASIVKGYGLKESRQQLMIFAICLAGAAILGLFPSKALAANDRLLYVMDRCCSIGHPELIEGPLTTAEAGAGGSQSSSGIKPVRGRIHLSPNGRLMAYQSTVETVSVARVDGSNARPVAWPAQAFSFNSDGTELLIGGAACPGICWLDLENGEKKATSIQGEPTLSPSGTKVVWAAPGLTKKTAETQNLFVANRDGSGATQITSFTSKSTPPGVWNIPQFGPNGVIAFWSGDLAKNQLWTIKTDGTGLAQLPNVHPGWFSWTPSGQINFTHNSTIGGSKCGIFTMNADGSNISRVPVNSELTCSESFPGKIPKAVYRHPAGGSEEEYLAYAYEPVLRFDSSEEWRPLNVDSFLAESQHEVCEGQSCSLISKTSDLNLHRGSEAEINIAGSYEEGGDEENYHSPFEECTATGLRDCDAGPRSSIYYRVGGTYGGYEYIDYWFLYRANYFGNKIGWHEGDWEGVTIAPSPTSSTFDYAAFSQHGTFYSYLRDVLRCEDAPEESIPSAGTCGTEASHSGHRVVVLPANSSHANYTTPCSEQVIFFSCSQNGDGEIERGYDGGRRWGRAFDETGGPEGALQPMPETGKELWTDWPGRWGSDSNSPVSPALQPVPIECASLDNGEGCITGPRGEGEGALAASALNSEGDVHLSPGLSATQCASWVGQGVAGIACDPRELRRAVLTGSVGEAGAFEISGTGRAGLTADGRGVAQFIAAPLRNGDQLKITGRLNARSEVLLRVAGEGKKNLVATVPVGRLATASDNMDEARELRLRLRTWQDEKEIHVALGGVEANHVGRVP